MSSIMREFRVGFGKSILGLIIWWLAVLSTEVSLLGQTGPEENQVAVNRGGARLLKLFEPGTLDFSGPGSWPRGSQVATDPEEDWINRFTSDATIIPIRPIIRKLPIPERSFLVV